MADEARRYWEAVVSGDQETAHAIANHAVQRLRMEADEAELHGKYLLPTALRQEAMQIERGQLAPYPRSPSFPMTGSEISRLEPGQRVTDRRGEEWVVVAPPHRDPMVAQDKPGAWSVGVKRLRDNTFTRIDCRNQWTLLGDRWPRRP